LLFFPLSIYRQDGKFHSRLEKERKGLNYIVAFSAGLLSFLSPCVLPLIPAYISYIVGSSVSDIRSSRGRINALIKTMFFVSGFSIVFILLGISVSSLSQLLSQHIKVVQQVGGVLIIVFGLHMTGVIKLKILYAEKRFQSGGAPGKSVGALLLGMAFAIGWTPCIGPILSSILIYAGSMETVGTGTLLLTLYALGLAVPFLASSLLIENLSVYLRKLTRYLPAISIVSGVIVIIMGVLVFTNRLEVLGQYAGPFQL
jgi:cytochrome c-type biogenesis protein